MPMPRLKGTDSEGILHIGKSVNLRTRIQAFRRSAEHGNDGHMAGIKFHERRLANVVNIRRLRYDFIAMKSREEAEKLERMLFLEYLSRHFELPPLDGTPGRYGAENW